MKQLEEKKIFSFDKNFSYKIFYSKPDKYKLLEEVARRNENIINIGSKKDYSIRHFAKIISEIIDYDNSKIKFDKTKYVGSQNKKLNISKVKKIINDYEKNLTDEKKGIAEVINWFLKKR